MKKIFAFILVLCLCVSLASVFSSCDNKKEQESEEPTEEATGEFVSKDLIKKLMASKLRMTRAKVHDYLKTAFFRHDTKYGRFELYKISDKQMALISYGKEKNDPTGMSDTVSSVEIVDTVDVALVDQIKEGYTYDKITEIFGGIKGDRLTSEYFGTWRYVLNDGKLLYIGYEELPIATSIWIVNENGETTCPHLQPIKTYSSKDMDDFRKYLIENYNGTGTKIAMPKLVSDEFELLCAYDYTVRTEYYFTPKGCDENDKEFRLKYFYVTVYKIDVAYEDFVNYYKDETEVVECGDGVVFAEKWGKFIFNNNGRAVVVDIPIDRREYYSNVENYSGTPITSLDDLNKYITIEYFYLSDEN